MFCFILEQIVDCFDYNYYLKNVDLIFDCLGLQKKLVGGGFFSCYRLNIFNIWVRRFFVNIVKSNFFYEGKVK